MCLLSCLGAGHPRADPWAEDSDATTSQTDRHPDKLPPLNQGQQIISGRGDRGRPWQAATPLSLRGNRKHTCPNNLTSWLGTPTFWEEIPLHFPPLLPEKTEKVSVPFHVCVFHTHMLCHFSKPSRNLGIILPLCRSGASEREVILSKDHGKWPDPDRTKAFPLWSLSSPWGEAGRPLLRNGSVWD